MSFTMSSLVAHRATTTFSRQATWQPGETWERHSKPIPDSYLKISMEVAIGVILGAGLIMLFFY